MLRVQETAGQIVPDSLVQLAMQNLRFRKSRQCHDHRRGRGGGGGSGAGRRRERLGLGASKEASIASLLYHYSFASPLPLIICRCSPSPPSSNSPPFPVVLLTEQRPSRKPCRLSGAMGGASPTSCCDGAVLVCRPNTR